MSPGGSKRKIPAVWIVVGVLGLVVAVRVVQALAGSIPPTRAGGELAILLTVAGLAALARHLLASATMTVYGLTALALVAWGGGVALPLWRLAYPAPYIYKGTLAGPKREAVTSPAPTDGRYEVRVKVVKEEVARKSDTPYVLRIKGSKVTVINGAKGEIDQLAEITLEQGSPATLFLSRFETAIDVSIRPVPLPRRFFLVGAIVAVLLALFSDLFGFRDRPRYQGLLLMVMSAPIVFLLVLDPGSEITGRAVLGAGGLAIVGGGLAGGVVSAVAGWLRKRAGR